MLLILNFKNRKSKRSIRRDDECVQRGGDHIKRGNDELIRFVL